MSSQSSKEYTQDGNAITIEIIGKPGCYQVMSTARCQNGQTHTARGRTFARIANARRDFDRWCKWQETAARTVAA